MAVAEEQIVIVDEWRGLYSESWKGVIVDEAFAHPAKFSRALIRRIYDHVIAEGWASKGDSVVDPFGGVALGAFPAMQHGLNWLGCELEQKFVELGAQNIALWNERYSRMPNWGNGRMLQGDSRKLTKVLRVDVDACVSSPPYVLARQDTTKVPPTLGHIYGEDEQERIAALSDHRYGESDGQLGTMKEGDLSLAISSPPYAETIQSKGDGIDWTKFKRDGVAKRTAAKGAIADGYGSSEGQLGAMREGDHSIAITSPPYNPPMSQDHNGSRGGQRGTTPSEKGAFAKYGSSEGQLEGMSMGGFNAAISSPPYEGNTKSDYLMSADNKTRARDERRGFIQGAGCFRGSEGAYGQSEGQLGIERGKTFWSASRLILEQLNQVLTPNAHAVFVVKAFVRDKKIVDFPHQWAQLCEAVGFKLLHDHHALLTEHYGTQRGFDGDKHLSVERKSFFRRLAEAKGSPRIDYENVLCFKKVA